MKKVLDATCGSRMIWFNKDNDIAIFCDKRELNDEAIWTSGDGLSTRYVSINPDVVADFTDLPFEDETFYHVIFDPPHLVNIGENAWMCKKYGKLDKNNWQKVIHDGFDYKVMADFRTPEDGEEILICSKRGYVTAVVFCFDDFGIGDEQGNDWLEDVVAWMPLPKPYKKEQEE